MVEIIIEVRVVDGVYIDMLMGAGQEFSEERVVPLSIGSMGRVEIL